MNACYSFQHNHDLSLDKIPVISLKSYLENDKELKEYAFSI